MLQNIAESKALSATYGIPAEDIQLISLNASCMKSEMPYMRVRFKVNLDSNPKDTLYLGVPIIKETPFYLKENRLMLNGETLGNIVEAENDTCDTSYFRRNDTALTINPNSRSLCTGCLPCATHRQDATDHCQVNTEEKLENYLSELYMNPQKNALSRPHFGKPAIAEYDFSKLHQLAIVTGCYRSEENAIDNIEMISKYFRKNHFEGEVKYIGSEIQSESGMKKLSKEVPNLNLCVSLECFERRNELLKSSKASITLEKAKGMLKSASDVGISTNFTYIVGLDSLEGMKKGLEELSPFVKRMPIFQVFQPHFEEQKAVRNKEADRIEYYLKARKNIEKVFSGSGFKPNLWENYRPMWYFSYDADKLDGIRI